MSHAPRCRWRQAPNWDYFLHQCDQYSTKVYLASFVIERFRFCPFCGGVLKVGARLPGTAEGKIW